MSFNLLRNEVIDVGLCQGCGLCVGSCKHLVMKDLKPTLKDFCIVDKNGQKCGRCFENCPQVRQKLLEKKTPLAVYSLQSTDPDILAHATDGGIVTTLAKNLLDEHTISQIVEVKNVEGKPKAVITTDSADAMQNAGVSYGRSGVLQKLMEVMGKAHEKVGIVGVPCEIRGADNIEQQLKGDFVKIGLFCNASIRSEATDSGEIISPCSKGCPAGTNASGYINAIRQGKYKEALEIIRDKNPLPSICGRICTHECEYNCSLIGTNHPIAIRELKKFVTDWEMNNVQEENEPHPKPTGPKVAVIGSGPAGLSCAWYLAKMGYQPTIFEKSDQIGGMLRHGIPKFRLPDEVLDYDIKRIQDNGVEIITNTLVGPEMTFDQLREQGFEAFFISIGQWKPKSFKLEGENDPMVYMAVEFLVQRKYNYCEDPDEFRDKIIGVMGGGPVGVDVAQTALRLGAKKVYLVDVQNEDQLALARKDIPEKEIQMMEYLYETGTEKFSRNEEGKLQFNSYKIQQVRDEKGLKFEKIPETDFNLEVDVVVIAVGQTVDYSAIDDASGTQLEKSRDKIVIDEISMATNVPGVFAGGDIVNRGKNIAIAAIAHGREAAISIDRYLKGDDLKEGRKIQSAMYFSGPIATPKDLSIKPPECNPDNLWADFGEIEGKFDEAFAINETKRCLSCNNFCAHCQDFAGVFADISAGQVGSEKGFTTVVAWTPKGQELIQKLISDQLVTKGTVNETALGLSIDVKAARPLMDFTTPLRTRILTWIKENKVGTISQLSEELRIPAKEVRNNTLRLVQDKKLDMKLDPFATEPIFTVSE